MPMTNPSPPAAPAPISRECHAVPPDRWAMILPHVAALRRTALAVSDVLPLQADGGDFVAALEGSRE